MLASIHLGGVLKVHSLVVGARTCRATSDMVWESPGVVVGAELRVVLTVVGLELGSHRRVSIRLQILPLEVHVSFLMLRGAGVARGRWRVTDLVRVCLNYKVMLIITLQLLVNRWEGVVPIHLC